MPKTNLVKAGLGLIGFVALAGCSSGDIQPVVQSNTPAPTASVTAPAAADSPAVSPGMIRQAQVTLQREGLYKGRIDGIWGPQSERALHVYQQSHDLTNSGALDSPTIASLQRVSFNNSSPMPSEAPKAAAPAQ